MCKIELLRGFNNTIYFVQKEASSDASFLWELKLYFRRKEQFWSHKARPVF